MHYFTWKLELVSNILWLIVDVVWSFVEMAFFNVHLFNFSAWLFLMSIFPTFQLNYNWCAYCCIWSDSFVLPRRSWRLFLVRNCQNCRRKIDICCWWCWYCVIQKILKTGTKMHYLWRFLFLHAVYLLWELHFSQNEQGKYVFQGFFFLFSNSKG